MLSRIFPQLKALLSWKDILGETGVSGTLEPLYLPGGILCMVVLASLFLHRMCFAELKAAVGESSRTLLDAGSLTMIAIYGMGITDPLLIAR